LTKLTTSEGAGTADSKIFESANPFRIESNLEALQVPTTQARYGAARAAADTAAAAVYSQFAD